MMLNFSVPRPRPRLCLQPLSPSSRRRLKQLTDKHGSGRLYQATGAVAPSRDLDLHLSKGELVAVLREEDTRGDRRRWLVDAGGETPAPPPAAPGGTVTSRCVSGCRQERLRPLVQAGPLSPASRGAAPLATPEPTWGAGGAQEALPHPSARAPATPGSALLPGDEVLDLR